MIARVSGKVVEIREDHVIIDVSGIGYKVFCSEKTLTLLDIDSPCSLNTEVIVRDDVSYLYGFMGIEEQQCFLLLLNVQGVGARLAMTILGHMSPYEIISSINSDDSGRFKEITGVGARIATRITSELSSRKDFINLRNIIRDSKDESEKADGGMKSDIFGDAISAMVQLGFHRGQAESIVREIIACEPEASLDKVVRKSLSRLSSN